MSANYQSSSYWHNPEIPPPEEDYFEMDYPDYETPQVCRLEEQMTTVYPFRGKEFLVTPETLESFAELFGIEWEQYQNPKELIRAIQQQAPCDWISKTEKWSRTSALGKYIHLHVTNYMMMVLSWVRDGEWTDNLENILSGINEAIFESPRPTSQFTVYRGSRFRVNESDCVIFDTPKSGSFYLEGILQGYFEETESVLFRIWIPRNSILSYAASEDQVIFPSGAKFIAVTDVEEENFRAFGEETPFPVQDLYYIGAPEDPIAISDEKECTPFSRRQFDSILDQWDANESFPFI